MMKFALAAVVALTATTAAVAADGEHSFTRDGQTYVYTAVDKGDSVVLQGRQLTSGNTFRLVVRGDAISGQSAGVPVSFRKSGAQAAVARVANSPVQVSAR
jgi:hypothetical protein